MIFGLRPDIVKRTEELASQWSIFIQIRTDEPTQ